MFQRQYNWCPNGRIFSNALIGSFKYAYLKQNQISMWAVAKMVTNSKKAQTCKNVQQKKIVLHFCIEIHYVDQKILW